ncbi:MAG TPA: DUF1232 domain-containing protein [Novosphingobium sp.]|nr:DUF1232 domain-containing protein [Novosphingobium sp. UBA6272]HQV04179.1 DUF1232 domain-containing protein [Novosphingobium sp.]
MWQRLRGWAKALRREVLLLWLAARDPRVPLLPKLLAVFVAGYALSPIDLIPDFIPVLGLLDDLVLVPAGIWLTLRLLPVELLAELRTKAGQTAWPRPSLYGAVFIAAVWLAVLSAGMWWWQGA